MNNTVNMLILDRGSCEKLHKKFRFADPVFITSGIYESLNIGKPEQQTRQLLIESSFLFNVVTIVRQKHGQGIACSDLCATLVWCPKISQLKKAKPFVEII